MCPQRQKGLYVSDIQLSSDKFASRTPSSSAEDFQCAILLLHMHFLRVEYKLCFVCDDCVIGCILVSSYARHIR